MNSWSDEPSGAEGPASGAPSEEEPLPVEVIGAEPEVGEAREVRESEATAGTIDFRDRWLRAEAELQNFRRRSRRDVEESSRSAEEGVMLEVIAALDDLDRALTAARAAQAPESLTAGVDLVVTRLREYLARQGVTRIDPVGETFDPNFHEALLEVDAPPGVGPGQVIQVALQGYRRGTRALRAERVVVSRLAPGGGR